MSAPESCSLRELARRLAVSDKVVRKAIASGRLKAVGRDIKGRPFVSDVALAITEMRENAGRVPVRTTGAAVGSASSGSAPEPADRPSARIISADTLMDAQRLAAIERARRDRLANDVREGRLVEVEKAAKVAFESERAIREAVLNIAPRLSAELAAESDATKVHIIVDAALREALNVAASTILEAANA